MGTYKVTWHDAKSESTDLIDLSNTTAKQDDVLDSKYFYNNKGEYVSGALQVTVIFDQSDNKLHAIRAGEEYGNTGFDLYDIEAYNLDTNLKSNNIKNGVTIFGVTGDHGPQHICEVSIEFEAGSKVTGAFFVSYVNKDGKEANLTITDDASYKLEVMRHTYIIIIHDGDDNVWVANTDFHESEPVGVDDVLLERHDFERMFLIGMSGLITLGCGM